MSSPVVLLNQMKSRTSPHKSQKRSHSSEHEDVSPRKKRAVGSSAKVSSSSVAAKSWTSLVRRNNIGVATPEPKTSGDVYELPAETEHNADENAVKKKATNMRAKLTRKLGQKKSMNPSPFKNVEFNKLGEPAGEAARPKVTLTSFDSPAKVVRRKENPLLALKGKYKLRPSSANDLGVGEVSRAEEAEAANDRRRSMRLAQQHKEDEERDREDEREAEDGQFVEDGEDESDGTSHASGAEVMGVTPDTSLEHRNDRAEQAKSESIDQQTLLEQVDARKRVVPKTTPQGETAPPNDNAKSKSKPSTHNQINRRHAQEQQDDASGDAAPAEDRIDASIATKKRGRPKKADAQKQAEREEEARRRTENAAETDFAKKEAFERRGRKFVKGIEQECTDISGVECWMKLGGAALTIYKTVRKKSEMDTPQTKAIWRILLWLSDVFEEHRDTSDERIATKIEQLKEMSQEEFLARDRKQSGDPTVVDLFEHLIPESVCLLKAVLEIRFHASYKHTWKELLTLVVAVESMCRVALDWQPHPSVLEGGVRSHVRNNIYANLKIVANDIRQKLDCFKQREETEELREELAKKQDQKRKEKDEYLAHKNLKLIWATRELVPLHPERPSRNRMTQIDDVDDVNNEQSRTKEQSRRPPIRRHPTEEIPAPDPSVKWEDWEDNALIQGLKRFRGYDRYDQLMEECPQLEAKTKEQCMARGSFLKQAFINWLAGRDIEGDYSFLKDERQIELSS